jgi:hypothetical protein
VSCNEIVFYCRNASHEDDEYEAMKATEAKNYYALAHTVREDIVFLMKCYKSKGEITPSNIVQSYWHNNKIISIW